ncbi:unnamed protein product [Clonostachys chloroleuca]|uniref:Uncharacterized protein n=1 Tax=Clonostachys chloroleuca TaxID=1926264 RepID=A0AA35LXD1_9HYPO|nr:unnamed protein product [Clonostachys chloroleuca]
MSTYWASNQHVPPTHTKQETTPPTYNLHTQDTQSSAQSSMSEKPSIFKTAPQEYEHPLPAYEEIASKPDYTCSASATYASSRPILFPRECAFFYRITHSHSHLGIEHPDSPWAQAILSS